MRILVIALVLAFAFAAVAAHHEGGEPSAAAKDIPGAKGTIEFKPTDWKEGETTYWKDTDGIDPGSAGCHVGTDENGTPNGRMFGEACLPDGLLVESNPGKDAVHPHTNDTGGPDTFDCEVWCKAQGKAGGQCTPAPAPPCEASAKCTCS